MVNSINRFLRKRDNSFFMLSVICILLIGFVVTSLISYYTTKRNVISSATSETLPLISDNIYSEIEAEILDPINISSLMSNDSFLINWISEGENNLPEITNYLNRIKERYGFTTAFYISDITRNYYYYDGILKQISTVDDHDIWYFRFTESGKSYSLDIDTDQAADEKLTVFINHRLENARGEYLGVTGVGLELNNLGNKVRKYQDRFHHKIYLVNEDGLVQVHPDQSLVETTTIQQMSGVGSLADQILATGTEPQIFEYRDSSGSKVISVRFIPEFDWFLIVEKDPDASLITARRALYQNIFIGVIITGIVSAVLLWIFHNYNQKLEFLATHDDLTGLLNRRRFNQLMQREIKVAQRYQQSISLLLIDIDDFKSVNDNYGHLNGDRYLAALAKMMQSTLREIDITGRFGGDEFCALLVNTDQSEAEQIADRLNNALNTMTVTTKHGDINRSVSIGIASGPQNGEEWQNLVHLADVALYHSKEKSKR